MKIEIEIKDESVPRLLKMIDEISTQDPLMTARPLYEVRDYREIVVDRDYDHDRVIFVDADCDYETLDDAGLLEKFNEWAEENEKPDDYLKHKSFDQIDWMQKDEFFEENNINEIAVKDVERTHGVYYTRDAAQAHIDANHYHYKKPFIYVVSAWRNPEYDVVYALFDAFAKANGKKCEIHR